MLVHNCHHYESDDWGLLLKSYQTSAILGLTATPERGDGRPLAGQFEKMVVAANYPDLIELGHLVPCKIIRPGQLLNGLAQDPIETYMKYGEGQKCFLFTGSVQLAQEYERQFRERGIEACTIHAKTPKSDRDAYLASFKRGTTRIICNVDTMTEGVDVPDVGCVILAANIGHVTPYLQRCGRGLRPVLVPGTNEWARKPDGSFVKPYCILIDLAGNSLDTMHGPPTMAREFSLENGIQKREGVGSLKVCMVCGFTYPPSACCPQCGTREQRDAESFSMPKIFDEALEIVFDGPNTPEWAKRRQLEKMTETARDQQWPLSEVVGTYQNLFGEKPEFGPLLSGADRVGEYKRLLAVAAEKKMTPRWAQKKFKDTFGFYPPRAWE